MHHEGYFVIVTLSNMRGDTLWVVVSLDPRQKKTFESSLFGNDTFPSALLTEMLLVGVTLNS